MSPREAQHGEVLLAARDLIRSLDKRILWQGISFDVYRGDILFLRGPSGVGKTLLLRTLACLDPVEGGTLRLRGKSPTDVGVPCWRAQVMYVHQQRVTYPGTPLQFFERAQGFASHKSLGASVQGSVAELGQLVEQLGMDRIVLNQPWAQLSGGQAQRMAIAISIALKPQVLLLDEPTSACDSTATLMVESVLRQVAASAALVWVTHDDQQPARVGGKVLTLPAGAMSNIDGSPLQDGLSGHSSSITSSSHTAISIPSQLVTGGEQQVPGGESSSSQALQAAWRQEEVPAVKAVAAG